MRCMSFSSTYGSFFEERVTYLAPPSLPAAPDDHGVRALMLLTRGRTEGRLAPRRDRRAAGGALALAAAVRVVHRVHDRPAHGWSDAEVPLATRLAPPDVLVRLVADDADGRPALGADPAAFSAREPERNKAPLAGDDLGAGPGAARQLRPAARLELDGVHHRADRDMRERQRVADVHLGVGAAHHDGADRQVARREDVALLAVVVVEERYVRRAVGVVLYSRDRRGHPVLVALEIYEAVAPFVPAADVAGGDAALVVAPARLVDLGEQLLLRLVARDRVAGEDRGAPATRARRLVTSCGHGSDPLEQFYPVALDQLHDGLLPRGSPAAREALALGLALHVGRVDLLDLHVEGLLDGAPYLVLVRPPVDLEGVLALALDQVVALLGDDRADYDLVRIHHFSSPLPASLEYAARENTTSRAL